MKSEPDVFSIADLKKVKTSLWDGVRNYQARNFMQKEMALGDEVLFYHSNAEPSGVAGRAKVVALATPDPTQFDKNSDYFDPKAKVDQPIWFAVKVGFVEQFAGVLSLAELKAQPELKDMLLLRKGQRLSVQPVSPKEFACICRLAQTL